MYLISDIVPPSGNALLGGAMNNSGSLLCCSYYGWELEGVHKRLYKIPWHCYQKESYPFHLMEADADRQGDAKAMLSAIAFNAAAVIEEILQTWL